MIWRALALSTGGPKAASSAKAQVSERSSPRTSWRASFDYPTEPFGQLVCLAGVLVKKTERFGRRGPLVALRFHIEQRDERASPKDRFELGQTPCRMLRPPDEAPSVQPNEQAQVFARRLSLAAAGWYGYRYFDRNGASS